MNTNYSHVQWRLRSAAVIGVFAAMVGAPACATDVADPQAVEFAPGIPTFIQDENLKPDQDWSNPGGWPSPMWSSIDEDTPNDDTDYINKIRTGLPPTVSAGTVELSDPAATPSSSQVHTLKVRWKVIGNYSTSTPQPTLLSYKLLQGDNVIAAGTATPNGSYTTFSKVLLQSEVDSITDYTVLRIKLEVQLKPASDWDQIEARVTWARLEIR
jgi:hypothetical protein